MIEPPKNTASLKWIGLGLGLVFGGIVLLTILPAWLPHPAWFALFSTVCHQIPDRSHQIDGNPFGVCIRCFWLYVGLAMGHIRFVFFQGIPLWRFKILMVTVAFSVLDWASGWLFEVHSWGIDRMVSGFFLGNAIALFTVSGVRDLIFSNTKSVQNGQTPTNHDNE